MKWLIIALTTLISLIVAKILFFPCRSKLEFLPSSEIFFLLLSIMMMGVSVPVGYECMHTAQDAPEDVRWFIFIEMILSVVFILGTLAYSFFFPILVQAELNQIEGFKNLPDKISKTERLKSVLREIKRKESSPTKVHKDDEQDSYEENLEMFNRLSVDPLNSRTRSKSIKDQKGRRMREMHSKQSPKHGKGNRLLELMKKVIRQDLETKKDQ